MAQDQNNQQVMFLPEGAKRTRGRDAQRINILIARAVANAVKSTLGPKGMDKMIVDDLGDVIISWLFVMVRTLRFDGCFQKNWLSISVHSCAKIMNVCGSVCCASMASLSTRAICDPDSSNWVSSVPP